MIGIAVAVGGLGAIILGAACGATMFDIFMMRSTTRTTRLY